MSDKPNQLDYEPSVQRRGLLLAHWLAVVSVAVGALNIIWCFVVAYTVAAGFPGWLLILGIAIAATSGLACGVIAKLRGGPSTPAFLGILMNSGPTVAICWFLLDRLLG